MIKVIMALVATNFVVSASKFFNCNQEIEKVKSEYESLYMVMQAHADGFMFSSECLELLLKRNFMNASDYLLNEYYPSTKIDTEIIVRKVANDIQR